MESLSWHAPEYYHERKTADWYWAVGIIAASAATVSVVFNNVILAALIGIGALTLMIFAARPPKIVEIKIDNAGVVVGKLRYPYANLQSFWIHEYERNAKLLFTSTKPLAPHLVIPIDLDDISAAEVRNILTPHLAEVEDHEPLLQLVMEYLGL
jgi:hypothetical protein